MAASNAPGTGAAPPLASGAPDPNADPNAAARQFAQTISEDDLYQRAQGLYAPFNFYPPDQPVVFVKFGGRKKQGEGDMQKLAFDWLRREREKNPSCNIHVPEVYKIFTKGGLAFILMQFLAATPVVQFARHIDPSTRDNTMAPYYGMVAEGVHLLSRMPVPNDATPGPFTRADRWIKHLLFKDHEAPVVYPTIQELEDHFNRVNMTATMNICCVLAKGALQVAERGYRKDPHPPTVTLERQLVFCYTDFNDENFMVTTDPDGRPRLYIVDFEHASFLPISFLSYAVFEPNPNWFLCKWIADRFGDSLPENNMEVMKRICYMFQVCSWRIGLKKK